jgi:RecA/RadA recombinase
MRKRIKEAQEARKARGELAAVAERFKAFRPAREVMKVVRAVPTRFVQFDHATRVGGMPIERFMLLHGPSNEGKSLLSLGLVESFLARGHLALYVDAERTTPITWVRELMGNLANLDTFFADKPDTYEETIKRVREFLRGMIDLKAKGDMDPKTSAIIVIDSLRKLVPEDLMKAVLKQAKDDLKGKDGRVKIGRDRGGQIKAKMNAAWVDELTPMIDKAGVAFVAIAREMVDPDASPFAKKFASNYLVGGGGAIFFEAALSIRTTRAAYVRERDRKAGEEDLDRGKTYGEKHCVTLKKTKVAGKEAPVTICHFHSSNGVFIPPGFDRARDVVDLGKKLGVIKGDGWLHWGKHRWQGMHAAVRKLTGEPGTLAALESEVREAFPHKAPLQVTDDGEVLE